MTDNLIWFSVGVCGGFVFFHCYNVYRKDLVRSAVLSRGWPALVEPIMDLELMMYPHSEVTRAVSRLDLPDMFARPVAAAIMSRFRRDGTTTLDYAVTRLWMELEGF